MGLYFFTPTDIDEYDFINDVVTPQHRIIHKQKMNKIMQEIHENNKTNAAATIIQRNWKISHQMILIYLKINYYIYFHRYLL